MSFVTGIHHIAIDVVAPTRQVHFLRSFGLDALWTFDRRGRYITCVGDPTAPPTPDGREQALLAMFFVPTLTQARLNHICFDVEDVDEAVRLIRKNGIKVDEEDADRIYGPEGLIFQIDSSKKPRREFVPGMPRRKEYTPIEEYEKSAEPGGAKRRRVPENRPAPKNAGMVTGIEHLGIDVQSPTRLAAFLKQAFGLVPFKAFHRRGRYITSFGNPDVAPDSVGRRRSFLPTFFLQGIDCARLNHVCFDVNDVEESVRKIEETGVWVDEEDADRIYGPENLIWQIDSRVKPRPEFLPGAKPRTEYTPLDEYDAGVEQPTESRK